MRLLTLIILTTASFLSLAQQKIINCFSSDYITPLESMLEINNIYVSNGLYKIELNNDIFPKYLLYYDTLHIPVWIPEKTFS